MSCETCGTCAWAKCPRVLCSFSDQDKPMNQQACCNYIWCADSVDEVAAEMLDSYARLYSRVSLRACQKSETQACISPSVFYNRLLALGVRV